MSQQERENLVVEFITEQRMHNKFMEQKVTTIERGMYGDRLNGVVGLIQKQEADEAKHADHGKRISSLEGTRSKLTWIWGGISAAFLFVVEFATDWIKQWFK